MSLRVGLKSRPEAYRRYFPSSLNAGELARAVADYAATVEADPARLASVERRRDLLYRLDQKYGPGVERVLATLEEARRELELLDKLTASSKASASASAWRPSVSMVMESQVMSDL